MISVYIFKKIFIKTGNDQITTLTSLENVSTIEKKDQWIEIFLRHEIDNQSLLTYCQYHGIHVLKIDE
ncbi:hypothetical protein [Faecalibacillus intestinalis]|uniref:hypothetical protein n=1 Tax=Faecalibacillus intestinalis TaxID=1982626 RepID=UPI00295ED495|nr:hypothetical protein [Faecalibacillus intestinalis]